MVRSVRVTVISGFMPPGPIFTSGGFAGRKTTIIGASLPSRVASLPSDGRKVLNRPVLMSPTVADESCRQSTPPWCAWWKARFRNGELTPSAMWYAGFVIEIGGASARKFGAGSIASGGGADGGTHG